MADGKDFMGKIKKFYFSLEDKYYDFLDSVNEHIPVYKLIDPIDKYVPSFVLVLVLLFLVLLLLFVSVFFPMFAGILGGGVSIDTGTSNALIRVEDEDGNPLSDVLVLIKLNGKEIQRTTDEQGSFSLSFTGDSVSIDIAAEKTGFKSVSTTLILFNGGSNILTLEKLLLPPKGFLTSPIDLTIVNGLTGLPIDDRTIDASFSCEVGVAPLTRIITSGTKMPITISESEVTGCQTLKGHFAASGFENLTMDIFRPDTTVFLQPVYKDENIFFGSIKVILYNDDGSTSKDVEVFLTNTTTGTDFAPRATGISGTVLFEKLVSGSYTLSARAADGRFISSDITLGKGENLIKELTLPQLQTGKKLFVKFVDDSNSAPLTNVLAIFRIDGLAFTDILTPNEEGVIEVPINAADEDSVFTVLPINEGYTVKVFSITPVNNSELVPQTVRLQKIGNDTVIPIDSKGSISVTVFKNDGSFASNTQVKIFNSSNIVRAQALTNSQGKVIFTNLTPGQFSARAIYSPTPNQIQTINEGPIIVKPNKETAVTITLSESEFTEKKLFFRVVDDSGDPVPGIGVQLFIDNQFIDSFTTDSAGEVTRQIDTTNATSNFVASLSKSGFIPFRTSLVVMDASNNEPQILTMDRTISEPEVGSLKVTVRDNSGIVVEGVQVAIYDSFKFLVKTGVTDSFGSVNLTDIIVGNYTVVAVKDSSRKEMPGVIISAGQQELVDLQFPPVETNDYKLLIKVVESSSQIPINGAEVRVKANGFAFVLDVTNAEGLVEIPINNSDSGASFTAEVSKSSYITDLYNVNVKSSSEIVPDVLSLSPIGGPSFGNGSLEVKVIENDSAIGNIQVMVIAEGGLLIGEGLTNNAGISVFANLLPATYSVIAFKQSNNARRFSAVTITPNNHSLLTLELPTENLNAKKLFFKVLDKDTSQPIVNAEAQLFAQNLPYALNPFSANAQGEFSIPISLAESGLDFTATLVSVNHIARKVDLTVVNSDSTSQQTFELEPIPISPEECTTQCGKVKVTVQDALNNPIKDAIVLLYDASFEDPLFMEGLSTAADGTVLFENIGVGSYFAMGFKGNLTAESSNTQLSGNQTANLTIILQDEPDTGVGKGSIDVRVLNSQGTALENVIVSVLTSDNVVVNEELTNSEGKTSFTNLPVGVYNISARKTDGQTNNFDIVETVIVKKDKTTQVVLSFPPLNEAQSKVFLQTLELGSGASVPGAVVKIFADGAKFSEGSTDSTGSYSVPVMLKDEGRTFQALISHNDFLTNFFDVTVKAESSVTPDVLELQRIPQSDPGKGNLEVTVKRGTELLTGATVRVFDSFNILKGETNTNSQGIAFFNNLRAGVYSSIAVLPQGETGIKTGITVLANNTTEIELQVPQTQLTEKKLFFKLVDSVTNEPVEDADIRILMNGLLWKNLITPISGIIETEVNLADASKSFSLWVTHEDYIADNFTLQVHDSSVAGPDEYTLSTKPPIGQDCTDSCANITVRVEDELADPLSGASVWLFKQGPKGPVFEDAATTGAAGTALFEKLKLGTYFAVASKDNLMARSASDQLTAGANLQLTVVLSTTTPVNPFAGSLKVNVYKMNGASKDPVQNAEVSIFKKEIEAPFNENPIKTDSDGSALFENLPLDSFFAIATIEEGNITLRGESLSEIIIANAVTEVEIILEERNENCLNSCGNIKVKVVTPDGEPVIGSQIELIEKETGQVFNGSLLSDNDGFALFENLPLKEFKAIAKKDLMVNESNFRQVVEGSTVNLEVELAAPSCKSLGLCGNIKVKVFENVQGNLVPVQGVEVFLFDDDTDVQINLNARLTDNLGEVVFEDLSFGIYRAEALKDLEVGFTSGDLQLSETVVLSITLSQENTLCNDGTCGHLLVKVFNDIGQSVPDVTLSLFKFVDNTKIPVNYEPGVTIRTNAQGEFKFQNLDLGDYSVTATKENLIDDSGRLTLDAGRTTTVELILQSGTATVTGTIIDSETGSPITGAQLEIFNAQTRELLASCLSSDASGICEVDNLVAGTQVYATASKAGYFAATRGEAGTNIHLNSGETVMVDFKLKPLPIPQEKLDIKFIKFCDSFACENEVTKIVSPPEEAGIYYAKFELTLQGDTTNTLAQLMAGSENDTVLRALDYKIKLKEAKAVAVSSIQAATCIDSQDKWNIKLDCSTASDSGAKIINLEYNDALTGQYDLTLKFLIQPGLPQGEQVELNYRAKADFTDESLETQLFRKQIVIGSEGSCSENAVSYTIKLQHPDGTIEELSLSKAAKKGLDVSSNYSLHYELFNCSNTAITNATLTIENKNVAEAITFPDYAGAQPHIVFSSATLPANSVTQIGSPILLKTEKLADFTDIEFNLTSSGSNVAGGTQAVHFAVVADKALQIDGLPTDLFNSQQLKFNSKVIDPATGNPIKGVSFEIYVNGQLVGSGATDDEGNLIFDPTNPIILKEGDKVELKVFKSGFAPRTINYEAKTEIGLPPVEYACISITPKEASSNIGGTANFTVTLDNCSQGAFIELSSLLPLSSGSFEMEDNTSKLITATADAEKALIGVNPILLKARLNNDGQLRALETVTYTVTDPNSCFTLDKYTYDLRTSTDTGTITNNCFFENNDPTMPEINISTFMVLLHPELAVPDTLTIEVSIITRGTEIYSTSPSEISVFSIDSRPITIKPRESLRTPLQDFNPFNPRDFIEGNPEKAITGLKQAPNYSGGLFENVSFIPSSNNSKVEVWIQGNQVWAKFIGIDKQNGSYPFTLTNKSLAGEQQATVTITDYVDRS